MTLNKEQQKVFDLYKHGKNVFCTGPGGTGKSHIIKQCIKYFTETIPTILFNNLNRLAICSTTGISATLLTEDLDGMNITAKTIFAWLKITPDIFCDYNLTYNWYDNPRGLKDKAKRSSNILECKTLIIDEVSMLSLKDFEMIDRICREVRKIDEPFGGIQILLFGDFFQLPPVNGEMCFKSKLWSKIFDKNNMILLEENYRQQDSSKFLNILEQIRYGNICNITKKELKTKVGTNDDDNIEMYFSNRKVNDANLSKYNMLSEVLFLLFFRA